MDSATRFRTVFIDKFDNGHDKRWKAFYFIACELLSKNSPVNIIETGTIRWLGNYAGDGQSTVLWDWIVGYTGGRGVTIDIGEGAIAMAKAHCPSMKGICCDSIQAISTLQDWLPTLDLLYLDSFDWTDVMQHRSALHHIGELAAAWENLRPGCLVAVDDCFTPDSGKHVMVLEFFRRLGVPPLVDGYLHVWRKPE